jgi:hypothetical protein
MNLSYEDIIVITNISRAMSANPTLRDAIAEDLHIWEWSLNSYKTPDLVIDFERRHIVVDTSEGRRLYYSSSLFHEIAGIAVLNNFQLFEDPWYTESTSTNDD